MRDQLKDHIKAMLEGIKHLPEASGIAMTSDIVAVDDRGEPINS